MKQLLYYFIFAIILYFILSNLFDNFNLEQENFDPSLVPISSIITLAKVSQKLINGNATLTNPNNLQIGLTTSSPGNLSISASTSISNINSLFIGSTLSTPTLTITGSTSDTLGTTPILKYATIGKLKLSDINNNSLISSTNTSNLLITSAAQIQILNNNLLVDRNTTVNDNLNANILNLNVNINAGGKIKLNSNPLIFPGSIVAYNGSTAPAGWSLCDGTNGTPDLRGRFIRMASNTVTNTNMLSHSFGDYGGSDYQHLDVSEMPAHTHNITDPGHTHPVVNDYNVSSPFTWSGIVLNNNSKGTVAKGDLYRELPPPPPANNLISDSLSSNITINTTGNDAPNNIQPPYYVLIYIMKVDTTITVTTPGSGSLNKTGTADSQLITNLTSTADPAVTITAAQITAAQNNLTNNLLPGLSIPPPPPAGFSIPSQPTNVVLSHNTLSSINASWDAVTYAEIYCYRLINTDSSAEYIPLTITTSTSVLMTGLTFRSSKTPIKVSFSVYATNSLGYGLTKSVQYINTNATLTIDLVTPPPPLPPPPPPSTKPSNLTVTNITSTSATIIWIPMINVSTYYYYVINYIRPGINQKSGPILSVNTSLINLTGLISGYRYMIYIGTSSTFNAFIFNYSIIDFYTTLNPTETVVPVVESCPTGYTYSEYHRTCIKN